MDLGKIIVDSIKYPFSDYKIFLILVIMTLITNLSAMPNYFGIKSVLIRIPLYIIGTILVNLLISGYYLRIIKMSLGGVIELPMFNNWIEMFIDGIKVSLVLIVYAIPAILIIIYSILVFVLPIIGHPITTLVIHNLILNIAIPYSITILYMIIIGPILAIAVAHMANNNSKFSAAFRFHEIMNKIGRLGWGNLIVWYIITGIIFVTILTLGTIIGWLGTFISNLIFSLTSPYLFIFLSKSIALFYMSE